MGLAKWSMMSKEVGRINNERRDVMFHLISYDLHRPIQNYGDLYKFFGKFDHKMVARSCWILKTNLTASQLESILAQYIDRNDKLIVVDFHNCACLNLPPDVTSWLPR